MEKKLKMLEERIKEEAQYLLYSEHKIIPVDDLYKHWVGIIEIKTESRKKQKIAYEIIINDDFPYNPPKIHFLKYFSHKIIKNNHIELNIIDYWRPDFHIYQIINAISGLLNYENPIYIQQKTKDNKIIKENEKGEMKIINTIENITKLETQITKLRNKLKEQTEKEEQKISVLPDKSDPQYITKLVNYIVEYISLIEKRKGNIILIKDFFTSFREHYHDTETNLLTLIKILKDLENKKIISGIKTINNQIKVLEIKPDVMSADIYTVLEIIDKGKNNYITLGDLMKKTRWDSHRSNQILNLLVKLGICRYINSYVNGERWYFLSSNK